MRKRTLIRMMILFTPIYLFTYSLQAQVKTDLGEEFYQLMLAFPDGFRSINSGPTSKYDKDSTQCQSKRKISGTSNNLLTREKGWKRWQLEAKILDDDDVTTLKEFEVMFNMFQNAINNMNMHGIKLVRTDQLTRINVNGTWFYKFSKWQIDNSSKNIDPKYLGFTIRLEIVDYGEGGTILRIVVTDQ